MFKALLLSAVAFAPCAFAQTPAPAPNPGAPRPAQAPLQVAEPRYETLRETITINAPADRAWATVGAFCAVGPANGKPCTFLAGDGDEGTVRSLESEVLVSRTPRSYTYVHAPRTSGLYDLRHGTLQITPVSATTSRLDYVLFFDASMLGDAAARARTIDDRRTGLIQRLKTLKSVAEGGRPQAAGSMPAPATDTPFRTPNPHYVVIPMQMAVAAPADAVWARIGHFCDIGKLGAIGYPTCAITSGTDGEYGVVRNIGREVLVGKAERSYTYAQQMRETGYYILYHGTIEARPVTAATSTLRWTLVYDNANLADDAAREKDIATRRARFLGMMRNVKILAEGGPLPPDAPPAN